jgi:phosphoserine phosphatase
MGDMDFVITLIADSERLRLPQAFVDSMAQVLAMQDVRVEKTEWLHEGAAVDLFAQHSALGTLGSIAQDAIRGYHFDVIVQPVASRKKKLLIADMESTIITCECLDELAEFVGLKDRIAAITTRAMNGEIKFEEALAERVGLLKDLPESALQQVMDEKVKLMPGAEALVSTMKKNGATTMLVSGGFDFFASRIKSRLGFDEARANRLEIKNGKLTGKVLPPILGKEAKLKALQEACATLKIKPGDVLAVGDGANDLPMLLAAGLGVAYHAKPTVRAQAKTQVNNANLKALLYAQGYKA